MQIMDRYLLRNFLSSYFICFVSLVGIHVIIDLFSNADEFLEDRAGTLVFLRRAGTYYFVHSFEYFNRLSPIITMISSMTTLAMLHRHNEIVALLAAGIPTKRALVPILTGTTLMIALGILNREVVLPRLSEMLQRHHEDIEADRALLPTQLMDRDQILIQAERAYRENSRLEQVRITLLDQFVGQLQHLQADRAYYKLDADSKQWGWLLESPSKVQIARPNDRLKMLSNGDIFLVSSVTFKDMIRSKSWLQYASTSDLVDHLQSDQLKDPNVVRIQVHTRLMQPILSVLLVLIGIPFVLQWERRNIFRSILVSMLLSLLFFVTQIVSNYFAEHGFIEPLFASWLPVFLFGPLAMALMHRIGT